MKGFIPMVIAGGAILLLVISTVLLVWVTWNMRGAKPYETEEVELAAAAGANATDPKPKRQAVKLDNKGQDVKTFYDSEYWKLVTPIVGNVIGLMLVSGLYFV